MHKGSALPVHAENMDGNFFNRIYAGLLKQTKNTVQFLCGIFIDNK